MAHSVDVQVGLAVIAALGLASAGIGAVRMIRAMGRSLQATFRAKPKAAALKPDQPVPFGWSTAWLAIRTRDTLGVIQALALTDFKQVGWQTGIAAIHSDDQSGTHVFVAPPVDGWTFVVGYALPHPAASQDDACTQVLKGLAQHFTELQYFFSDPTADHIGWSRYQSGKATRRFAAIGADMVLNEGTMSDAESALGLTLAEVSATPAARTKLRIASTAFVQPDEEALLKLAGHWSLDPTALTAASAQPSLGFLGRAPASWRRLVAVTGRRFG
jgi:hypothetical protein